MAHSTTYTLCFRYWILILFYDICLSCPRYRLAKLMPDVCCVLRPSVLNVWKVLRSLRASKPSCWWLRARYTGTGTRRLDNDALPVLIGEYTVARSGIIFISYRLVQHKRIQCPKSLGTIHSLSVIGPLSFFLRSTFIGGTSIIDPDSRLIQLN